jgi:hypothetical protein
MNSTSGITRSLADCDVGALASERGCSMDQVAEVLIILATHRIPLHVRAADNVWRAYLHGGGVEHAEQVAASAALRWREFALGKRKRWF